MLPTTGKYLERFIDKTAIWIIFFLGIWLVVIKPFGPNWSLAPGDLADGRFNNFILEHFFRWISGSNPDFWNGHLLYPFQQTIAFSDNFLGTGFFYAVFRWAGLDRETSFQGWYVLGCCFNYLAAVYVLSQLKFRPLATGIGAFFFTFGLPILAQEAHPQLLYRFGIPLATFFLWKFFHEPRLRFLAAIIFWTIWQFYVSIYLGFFLAMILLVSAILLPLSAPALSFWGRLTCWLDKFKEAWSKSNLRERLFTIIGIAVLGISFITLIAPYYSVSKEYGFHRSWVNVIDMLPQPASFLLSDRSQLWGQILGSHFYLPARVEHSLFPGLTVLILLLIGVIFRFDSKNSRLAWVHFWTIAVLTALTLYVDGGSLYWFIFNLPGINSLRGVTRIHLVLMWPLALFIAWVMDELLARVGQKLAGKILLAFLFTGLLITESTLFNHATYSKKEAQLRLLTLSASIPPSLPANPVIAVKTNEMEPDYMTELDAMLLAQERGWSTMNGYTSNIPFHYNSIIKCIEIPNRIKKYMKFKNISDQKSFYLDAMKRIVPVGFADCDPSWWEKLR